MLQTSITLCNIYYYLFISSVKVGDEGETDADGASANNNGDLEEDVADASTVVNGKRRRKSALKAATTFSRLAEEELADEDGNLRHRLKHRSLNGKTKDGQSEEDTRDHEGDDQDYRCSSSGKCRLNEDSYRKSIHESKCILFTFLYYPCFSAL